MNGLADVLINPAALFDGINDGGEVVIRQNHIRRPLGNIGSRDPHRAADIRFFESGSIVDAVPRHGNHIPARLPRTHDAHLVFRRDTGVNGDVLNAQLQRLLIHAVQITPGGNQPFIGEDSQFSRYGNGGGFVVSGNHNRANTRRAAGQDSGFDFHSGGIYHPRHPRKD